MKLFWHDLTEEQKQQVYQRYLEEVETKHTEDIPMTYEEYRKEADDCEWFEIET